MSQKQQRFLEAFVKMGRIGSACRAIGLTRQTHYDWLKADPAYEALWKVAVECHQEYVDELILDRITDPTGNRGSDILLIFYAKAINAAKYREQPPPSDDTQKQIAEALMALAKQDRKQIVSAQVIEGEVRAVSDEVSE